MWVHATIDDHLIFQPIVQTLQILIWMKQEICLCLLTVSLTWQEISEDMSASPDTFKNELLNKLA
jgi:hypothetical protein